MRTDDVGHSFYVPVGDVSIYDRRVGLSANFDVPYQILTWYDFEVIVACQLESGIVLYTSAKNYVAGTFHSSRGLGVPIECDAHRYNVTGGCNATCGLGDC